MNKCIEPSMWALSPTELSTLVSMDSYPESEYGSSKCQRYLVSIVCELKQKFKWISSINEYFDTGNQNI